MSCPRQCGQFLAVPVLEPGLDGLTGSAEGSPRQRAGFLGPEGTLENTCSEQTGNLVLDPSSGMVCVSFNPKFLSSCGWRLFETFTVAFVARMDELLGLRDSALGSS